MGTRRNVIMERHNDKMISNTKNYMKCNIKIILIKNTLNRWIKFKFISYHCKGLH